MAILKTIYAENLGSKRMPKELSGVEIIDKLGVSLPLQIFLTDHNNKKVRLLEYFLETNHQPVILTLGYYGCPMLCSLVLNGLVESLKNISFKPGIDYKIISVSIDHREEATLALQKQKNYTNLLNNTDGDFWIFHVGDETEIKQLSDAVGFNFYFDKKNNQFAHGAGIFILTPRGKLSRTLYGISFSSSDLKMALQESSEGKIGTILDRIILSCFHYDPDSHRYGVYILGVMRIFGLITILALTIFLFKNFKMESRWKT